MTQFDTQFNTSLGVNLVLFDLESDLLYNYPLKAHGCDFQFKNQGKFLLNLVFINVVYAQTVNRCIKVISKYMHTIALTNCMHLTQYYDFEVAFQKYIVNHMQT